MSGGARRVGSVLALVRGSGLWLLASTAGLLGLWALALAGSAGATALPSNCSLSGTTVTCSYVYTGAQQSWKAPAGVRSVHIDAIGGTGGTNETDDGFGGYGGTVSADVATTGGSTLYVEVGGNGSSAGPGGLSGSQVSGGAGGVYTHSYQISGGGGGASVVQTCSAGAARCVTRYDGPKDPRRVVAGGGGGGGGDDGCNGGSGGGGVGANAPTNCGDGGGGGNGTGGSGQQLTCENSTFTNGGGGGATPSAVGAGGNSDTGETGQAGSGPRGGNGYPGANADTGFGGGGGGGYYGGGGGGATNNCDTYGFGGGAGSSFAAGTHVIYGNDTTARPSVTISYKLVTLSGLRVSPRRVSIAGRKVNGKCVKPTNNNAADPSCRRMVKLTVAYTLNTAASVKFTVQRKAAGRKVNGKCVAPKPRNKHHKRCTRLLGVRGKLVKAGAAGANHFVWSGKIGGRKLAAGSYELTASPAGASETVTFTIVG